MALYVGYIVNPLCWITLRFVGFTPMASVQFVVSIVMCPYILSTLELIVDIVIVGLHFPLVHRIPAENISCFFPTAIFFSRGLLGSYFLLLSMTLFSLKANGPRKHKN